MLCFPAGCVSAEARTPLLVGELHSCRLIILLTVFPELLLVCRPVQHYALLVSLMDDQPSAKAHPAV